MYLAMLDLETMSVQPDASVVALAVVLYNLESKEQHQWEGRISPQLARGRQERTTMDWWATQDLSVREHVFGGVDTSLKIIRDLNNFLEEKVGDTRNSGNFQIYADPAAFDFPILKLQYIWLGLEIPWSFRQENCLGNMKRTMIKAGIPITEVLADKPHNPLSDTIAQMQELIHCIDTLNEFSRNSR